MVEIDTDGTDNIICPNCGYEDHNSWEAGDGTEDFSVWCDQCGEGMRVMRHFTVSYSSEKLEKTHD